METVDVMVAPLKRLNDEYDRNLKAFYEAAQNELGEVLKVFMKYHPEFESFGWEGSGDNYDDNSYYFAINKFYVDLNKQFAEKIDTPERLEMGSWEQIFVERGVGWPSKEDKEKNYLGGRLGDDVRTLAATIRDMEEVIKNVFGEWATVTVTHEGLTING